MARARLYTLAEETCDDDGDRRDRDDEETTKGTITRENTYAMARPKRFGKVYVELKKGKGKE